LNIALKEHYTANTKLVPVGFQPKKAKPQIEETDAKPPMKVEEDVKENKPASSGKVKVEPEEALSEMKGSQDALPSTPIKRVGSLEKVAAPEQETFSQRKVERKTFSLVSLMRPTSSTPKAQVSKSNAGKLSLSGQPLVRQQKMPEWISEVAQTETLSDETRSHALDFLRQAAPFIPHGKHVNHDAISRALEASIYDWAKEGNSSDWVDNYWVKVDDIIASISGNDGVGTVATLIADGRFKSPDEIVRLSDDAMLSSFEGKPLML
jgi:hypothetical protein